VRPSPPRKPPVNVFWALTNACDHACRHCRSDSGQADPDELDPADRRALAHEIAALGPQEVVLTGGDPLAASDWRALVEILVPSTRVRVHATPAADPAELVALGVSVLTLSLDGPAAIHDALRPWGRRSSHAATLRTLARARSAGLPTRVVTTVSRPNLAHLEAVYQTVRDHGVARWQVQLLQLHGRARSEASLHLPLNAAEAVLRVLRRAHREGRVEAPMHCTVGYLVPEELVLRSHPWQGTRAGLGGLAISATGAVSGCPCLPPDFAVGQVPTRPLAEIWQDDACFPYSRAWDPAVLTGDCAPCRFALRCRAGCPGLAYGLTGTIGANPACLRPQRPQVASSKTGS